MHMLFSLKDFRTLRNMAEAFLPSKICTKPKAVVICLNKIATLVSVGLGADLFVTVSLLQ